MALDSKRLLKPVKKLRKLVGKLDRHPAPEIIHELRTSTRKVEAAFETLIPGLEGVSKSAIKGLRHCRKRAGKVRDMDVLTDYASKVHQPGEEECTVRLLEYLGVQRLKYATKLYTELRGIRAALGKGLKRTEARLAKLSEKSGDRASGSSIGPKAAGTALTLAVQLGAPSHLDRQTLHPYRLKIKELRNILRMAAGDNIRLIADLTRVKDAIGEWHDWEVLLSIARNELNHGNRCKLLLELKRITQRKYDRALALAHELRRNYLRGSHPQRDRASATSSSIPREPVWEAIAMLAA